MRAHCLKRDAAQSASQPNGSTRPGLPSIRARLFFPRLSEQGLGAIAPNPWRAADLGDALSGRKGHFSNKRSADVQVETKVLSRTRVTLRDFETLATFRASCPPFPKLIMIALRLRGGTTQIPCAVAGCFVQWEGMTDASACPSERYGASNDVQQRIAGVGLGIEPVDGRLIVVALVPAGPAHRSGQVCLPTPHVPSRARYDPDKCLPSAFPHPARGVFRSVPGTRQAGN